MSRRAKESDASLAFSTTTIDDDDEFFWIFSSSVVCFGSFFVCFGSLCVLCSQHYSVSSEAVLFILRANSLAKKDKRKEKRNTKTKIFTSPFFFIRVVNPKFSCSPQKKFSSSRPTPDFPCRASITPTQREPQKTTRAPV